MKRYVIAHISVTDGSIEACDTVTAGSAAEALEWFLEAADESYVEVTPFNLPNTPNCAIGRPVDPLTNAPDLSVPYYLAFIS